MTKWGLTPHGFKAKSVDEIKNDIQNDMRAAIRDDLNFGPESTAGQITQILASRIGEVWQVAQALYGHFDPNTAEGHGLSTLSSLTGTTRLEASKSLVSCQAKLEQNTILPKGTLFYVDGNPSARFITRAEASSIPREGETLTPGPDGTVFVSVALEATEYGPVAAPAGKLTKPETIVSGLKSITNPEPAILGRYAEQDDALKKRRRKNINTRARGTESALIEKLDALSFVRSVKILTNNNDEPEAGIPAHAFECVVLGGDETTHEAIAQIIWNNKPLGVMTHGNTQIPIKTSGGKQKISFSRPNKLLIRLNVRLRVKDDFKDEAAVKDTIKDFSDTHYLLGVPVYLSQLYAKILQHPTVVHIESATAELIQKETDANGDEIITLVPFDGAVRPSEYAVISAENIHIEANNA